MTEQRPRRRMDRRELNAATRIIERLVRSKAVIRKPTKEDRKRRHAEGVSPSLATPPERPAGYRQSMHIGLDATDLANLDKILGRMKSDPLLGRLKAELGREKATRYAIAYCAEHMPARITATS
jgi:hypothetical protein